LVYEESERDLVVLYHEFGVVTKDDQKERHLISMVEYGDPNGYSAMAKTVGFPAALGADLVLNGGASKGVITPTTADVYKPLLTALKQEGFKFQHIREVIP
jgi:saccharopine dehydrogenase-like NADP-dependent oxidoreductase